MSSPSETHSAIYLRPGELCVCSEPTLITTVLGSCVAVTMFNPRLHLAAICHALLANPSPCPPDGANQMEPYKYVSLAIPAMIESFFHYSIAPAEIEVKLFGGASVFVADPSSDPEKGVGFANIRRAREILEAANLRISRMHVGGEVGRKLIFNTETGVVMLKKLSNHSARDAQH